MARITNQQRIIRLLFAEPDGLSSTSIKLQLNLSDRTYDRERERLLVDGVAQKTRGRGGGLKLTVEFLEYCEKHAAEAAQEASTGTAFFVSHDGHLMTNCHVIEGASRIVVFYKGATFPASVVAADPDIDLALIQVERRPDQIAAFKFDVHLGDDLGLFGYPLVELLSRLGNFSRGSVTGLAGIFDEPSQFQIQAPVQGGNSGGPVADSNGSVLGVVSCRVRRSRFPVDSMPENANFAIRADVACAFAEGHGLNLMRSNGGASQPDWPRVARNLQAMTALVYCDGGLGEIPDLRPPATVTSRYGEAAPPSPSFARKILSRLTGRS